MVAEPRGRQMFNFMKKFRNLIVTRLNLVTALMGVQAAFATIALKNGDVGWFLFNLGFVVFWFDIARRASELEEVEQELEKRRNS